MTDYRASHLAGDCAQRFDGHYVHGRGRLYWEAFERPYLERLFARLGREHPGRYLDFACGTGRILTLGARHFAEAVGIDVSDVMLEEARRRVPGARLIQADILDMPPDVGTFSVISLFRFVLSAEPWLRDAVLRWLRSVMAPDGVLIVNNHLNRRSATGLAHLMKHVWRGRRWTSPDDRDMESWLAASGFAIAERYGFGIMPPWRGRRFLPSGPLLALERALAKSRALQPYTKDRIFICTPL